MKNSKDNVRLLSDSDSKMLVAGEPHYRSYIGPPSRYDLMGAAQFRLLTTLGLRDFHRVLDFGCGSLRAGRMLIAYLQKACYYGIEPNQWLITDAIDRQLGQDLINLKQPSFSSNSDFTVPFIKYPFDFVLAQSIFSHTGRNIARKLILEFAKVLSPFGIVAATFSLQECSNDSKEEGWVYPQCVKYSYENVLLMVKEAGLVGARIPFYHPTQSWFLFAKDINRLPSHDLQWILSGAVFNVEEFSESLKKP
jgi:SAM-dependent methyltransferase